MIFQETEKVELMKIFLQCGIVEHSGHGVPIVVREYGEKAYTFSQNMITVTIPFSRPKQIKNAPVNAPVKLTATQTSILNLIKEDANITIEAIVKILGKDRRTITRNISVLKEKELIGRVGSDKSGHWEIKG